MFTSTLAHRRLVREYSQETYGSWHIRGTSRYISDTLHLSDLGFFKGTLHEAIKYAVNLEGFWTNSVPGSILLSEIIEKEDVSEFLKEGIRQRALSKLTNEEKQILGLE